jgi:glycosyltransferase involved in cell wall biosynthesis
MNRDNRKHVLFLAANARSLLANRGDLIREIQAQGHHVSAIVPSDDFLPEISRLKIEVALMPLKRTGTNPARDVIALYRYWRLIRRFKPDIVYAYGAKPVIYGLYASKLAKVPNRFGMITGLGTVFIRPNRGVDRLLRGTVSMLYRNAFKCAKKVFFQNPDDITDFKRARILKDDAKAVRTMGSGVNLTVFERSPFPAGEPVFLFIGRLLTEKGLSEFCESAMKVKTQFPEARFIAVGPYDANLPHSVSEEQLEHWRAAGAVEFVGGVKNVRPYLRDCSVFVLPSYREGTPRSVLEAMATGRPIITTDAPGCRETVHDGENGFLVPVANASALSDAMLQFLRTPALIEEMGERSYQMVVAQYDVRSVNRVIIKEIGL